MAEDAHDSSQCPLCNGSYVAPVITRAPGVDKQLRHLRNSWSSQK
jgi:hypothetical protein